MRGPDLIPTRQIKSFEPNGYPKYLYNARSISHVDISDTASVLSVCLIRKVVSVDCTSLTAAADTRKIGCAERSKNHIQIL